MCLISLNKNPRIAEKDIVCYKWLDTYFGELYSPFVTIPIIYKLKCLTFAKHYTKPRTINGLTQVEGGYIHACISMLNWHMLTASTAYKYKAIIPKGARYYVGTDGDICADRIIIVRRIRQYEYLYWKYILWKQEL